MKFRKKPVVIEATRWFKNGDHPADDCRPVEIPGQEPFLTEGMVVRYYRRPDVPGDRVCQRCQATMHEHGWIDTPEDGHMVCPGDWIITGISNERYPCKDSIFRATYEPVDEEARARLI